MIIDIALDKLDKNGKQGIVGKISKKAGDSVKMGEKILQIESAKGNTIINSKAKGIITEILVSEGDKVKIGDKLLRIEKES